MPTGEVHTALGDEHTRNDKLLEFLEDFLFLFGGDDIEFSDGLGDLLDLQNP